MVEVQAYRAGHLLDASDDAILSLALQDLAVIHPAYAPEHLRHFTVNRHRALFTRYGPGQNVFRPVAGEAPPGLALAGDWTRAPWSAWMMERAVISGLQAANAVLERRQLSPVEILRLSPESLFLRVSRALCLLLRLTVSRRLPMGQPPTDDALSAHLEFDHHLIGWVNMLVAVCNLLPLFAPEFRILSQIWPTPFLAVSVYFLFHTEPDVRYRYGTWLRAWADTPTLQHRFMTAGALVAGVAELATGYLQQTSPPLRTLFPLGLVASGIVFYGHHHGGKAVIHRQHNIMAWLFIVTGLTLLVARFIPSLAPLQYAWPMLYGVLAYVFVTYTEEEVHAHGEVGHDDGDAVHAAIVHRHGEES